MKYIWGMVCLLAAWHTGTAQTLNGHVITTSGTINTPVENALVGVKNTSHAALTDTLGAFTLKQVNLYADTLLVSAMGYITDTVILRGDTNIQVILGLQQMKAVNVEAKKATRLEMTPMNVEVINSGDLVKDACCTLSESFENSATVDMNFTDAVSGAKEIRMLGLDGIYTQIMIENVPSVRSLGNTFGLNYIPGPWMNSIQVNKGTGSVLNGYESITGQINVEYKKPQNAERLFANLYLNQDMRTELNVIAAQKINKQWATLTAVHGTINWLKQDMNKDGYLDNPLVKGIDVFNRFSYLSGKVFSFWSGITANLEDRTGGQVKFNPAVDNMMQSYWGFRLRTARIEAFAKTGFNLPGENFIGIQYKYIYQNQSGYVGRNNYNGLEHFGYVNLIYQKTVDERDDMIKVGASVLVDNVGEQYDTFMRKRTEVVPGLFTEGTFSFGKNKKVMLIAGLRGDYHNLYGPFFSPRLNVKWNITYDLSLRISAGRGYRVPTMFAENFGLLASNRTITINPNTGYEEAWNYGVSLTYKFFLNFREGFISIDYYRTDFVHRMVVDIENTRQLQFYDLTGRSFANAAQVEASYEVVKGFDVKLAYKYETTKTDYTEGRRLVPLRPWNRGLVSLQYTTRNNHWRFNTSMNWYGKTRIPDTSPNDVANRRPSASADWFQLNAQVTFKWKKWEVYAGGENLLNFTQKSPIIAADQPFSNQFDASLIWGPLRGAMAFAGVRFTLK